MVVVGGGGGGGGGMLASSGTGISGSITFYQMLSPVLFLVHNVYFACIGFKAHQ